MNNLFRTHPFVILFILFAFSFSACSEQSNFDEILKNNVEQMKAQRVGKEIEKGVKCIEYSLNGREVTEKYMLLNYASSQVDGPKFKKNYSDSMKSILCEDPNLKLMWENGVTFKYLHFGNDNVLISEFILTAQDCGL